MSSYKASTQGTKHKRIPDDISENPIIIGHEFCGKILEVGSVWKGKFKPGDKFSIQPALNDPNGPVGTLSAPDIPTLLSVVMHSTSLFLPK